MKERCARGGFAAALVAALLATAGCGGARQDENEPSGQFKVDVTRASFPAKQSIAQPTRMKISVHNADNRAVPDMAVTVETRPSRSSAAPLAFGQADADTRLADTAKPIWILDAGPAGGNTAATNTWALGPMNAGETKTFTWRLTAVKAGTYTVAYRVAPGLNGKARPAGGHRIDGTFQVTISDKPVPARVDDNGNVVRGQKAKATKGL